MNPALLKIIQYEAVSGTTNASGERSYAAPIQILGKIEKRKVRNWQAPLEKLIVRNTLYTNHAVTKNSRVRNVGDAKGYIIKEEIEGGKYVLE